MDEAVEHRTHFLGARTRFRVSLKAEGGFVDARDALQ
jgi:hypothetical protein